MAISISEALGRGASIRVLPPPEKPLSNNLFAKQGVREPIKIALVMGFECIDAAIKGRRRFGTFIENTRRDPEVQKAALSFLAIAAEALPNNSIGRIAREIPAVIKGAQAVRRYWNESGKGLLEPSPEGMRLLTASA